MVSKLANQGKVRFVYFESEVRVQGFADGVNVRYKRKKGQEYF